MHIQLGKQGVWAAHFVLGGSMEEPELGVSVGFGLQLLLLTVQ